MDLVRCCGFGPHQLEGSVGVAVPGAVGVIGVHVNFDYMILRFWDVAKVVLDGGSMVSALGLMLLSLIPGCSVHGCGIFWKELEACS